MPTQTEKPPAEIVVCWNPGVDTHLELAVARGQRLRGDHPYVERHAADFVPDDENLPSVQAMVASQTPAPEPAPTGTVKVRMIGKHQRVVLDGREFRSYQNGSGDKFECDAADAERLISEGHGQAGWKGDVMGKQLKPTTTPHPPKQTPTPAPVMPKAPSVPVTGKPSVPRASAGS